MRRILISTLAGFAGVAVAVVATAAVGKSFTLRVHKNVHVTNTPTAQFRAKPVDTHASVAVGSLGYAVYVFQGETTHHIICKKTTNANTNCSGFWPPVTVSSANGISKETGIKGKLGTFRNHHLLQLTLNGQPVYYFQPDISGKDKGQAEGDELNTFGSTWHIVTAGAATSSGTTSTEPTTTTTTPTMTTTTTTTCPTAPYCY